MNPNRMPAWESDFWSELLAEQGVFMDDRPMGATTGRFAATGGPDAFFYAANPEAEYVSPYATADMLVGEIVEEGQLELDA
jgi:hypothetical protein